MALVEKEAAAEIQIIEDTYDQTLWLHCSSWWPAHWAAWFQLAASDLRNRLPWGAIGKLWTQGLSLHHTELWPQSQQCQPQPGPSCRMNTFTRHALQACRSPFQTRSCIQDNRPGCKPTLPLTAFSWSWLSDSKGLTLMPIPDSPKTLFFRFWCWLSVLLLPWYFSLSWTELPALAPGLRKRFPCPCSNAGPLPALVSPHLAWGCILRGQGSSS